MRTHNRNSCGAVTIALLMAAVAGQAGSTEGQSTAHSSIEGLWSGAIEIPGEAVPPIIFRIINNLDGQLNAHLESPDQMHRIRANRVTFTNGNLRLDVDEIGGAFEGKAAADNVTIKGKWTQGGHSFELVVKRIEEQPRPNRPQERKRPYPYTVEEVAFENKAAGVKLAGTLTLRGRKAHLRPSYWSAVPAPSTETVTRSGIVPAWCWRIT